MSRLRARKLLSCLSESLYSEYKLESLKGTSRLPWSESGYPRLTGVLPGQSQRSATSWVCRALFVSARTSGYSDYRRDSAVSSIVGTIEFQNYSRRCKSTRSDHKKESIKKGKNSNDGVLLKLSMPAASLECLDRVPAVPTANENVSSFRKILLWLGGYYSKQSVLMRAAAELNECINEQALNENVLAALEIPDKFQSKHAFLSLHVWLILRRLFPEGRDGKQLSQLMYDNFQDQVEHMVRSAGVQVRLQKHLTELEKQFYGSCTAYDTAIGDEPIEPLASALLRNVYLGDDGKLEAAKKLETYVLREIACLAKTPSRAVLHGFIRFP